MNTAVRLLVLSGLRQRYPQATTEGVQRRLAAILLSPELAAAHAYRATVEDAAT